MTDHRAVHLVNRRGESILGRPALRSLAELDEPVDLVVVTVPAHGFEAAVDDALKAGARAIVGVTAGFAELGADGRALQDRIVERVRSAGAVLLGPNCLGVLDSSTSLTLASNPLPPGRIALLSQSGNMALELSGFLEARGHGFSRFVSLGNQADLSAADLIQSCVDHPDTDLIAVYCEDFGDGRAFVAAATQPPGPASRSAAHGRRKRGVDPRGPVAYRRADLRHRGHRRRLPRRGDRSRRHARRELADTAERLLRSGRHPVHRLAVIADGGGHAGSQPTLVDAAGLSCRSSPPRSAAHCGSRLPPSAGVANPVDLAGAGEQDITSSSACSTRCSTPGDRLGADHRLLRRLRRLRRRPVPRGDRRRRPHGESRSRDMASRSSCTRCATRATPRACSPTPASRCSRRSRTPPTTLAVLDRATETRAIADAAQRPSSRSPPRVLGCP